MKTVIALVWMLAFFGGLAGLLGFFFALYQNPSKLSDAAISGLAFALIPFCIAKSFSEMIVFLNK